MATQQEGMEEWSPSLSPTLRGSADGMDDVPAFEVKFLIDETLALAVERRIGEFLVPDSHGDAGGEYGIASLYCDTPDWGAFFRLKPQRGRKYRVRRYEGAGTVYLEEKTVKGLRVHKRRESVDAAVLGRIHQQGPTWAGAWYAREVARRGLAPVCRVSYSRRAFCGDCPEGPMRVTIDRRIRGSLEREWSLEGSRDQRALLPGFVVCEFKFLVAMPAPLKGTVAALGLAPQGVSKYRACIRAFASELGVGASGSEPDA